MISVDIIVYKYTLYNIIVFLCLRLKKQGVTVDMTDFLLNTNDCV